MPFLKLENVVKRFGPLAVVKGVSLAAEKGEFVVFVGPSGCGKSTLLRMIAGLEDIDEGSLSIDGEEVTHAEPARRHVSMVFQSYALYPHMTVYQNIAFGLEIARQPKPEIERRVTEAARILQIEPLLQRKPRQLSGGQRQRVAIGRAIVRNPKIFLFDEPLSNLDAELRAQMRVELARLHKNLGATIVYVTHDQIEAMTLADRIVVVRAGVVEQIGSPADLYDRPANTFVAGFIGSPKMNLFPASVTAASPDGIAVASAVFPKGAWTIAGPFVRAPNVGDTVTLGLRPEALAIGGSEPIAAFTVDLSENLGGSTQIYGRAKDGGSLTVLAHQRASVASGDRLEASLGAGLLHVFDAAGLSLRA